LNDLNECVDIVQSLDDWLTKDVDKRHEDSFKNYLNISNQPMKMMSQASIEVERSYVLNTSELCLISGFPSKEEE